MEFSNHDAKEHVTMFYFTCHNLRRCEAVGGLTGLGKRLQLNVSTSGSTDQNALSSLGSV